MRINEMTTDYHPSAYSFWCRYILLICQESEQIYKICFLSRPTNLAVGDFSRKDCKEVIGGGVRSYPFGAEKILIERCDAMGSSSKPTIGEGGIGYARCGALRFCCSR